MNNNYYFYNISSLKNDNIDKTQNSIMNTKISNYYVSNYLSESSSTKDNHIDFATQEPNIFFNGSMNGTPPRSLIDIDSTLLLKPVEERSLEKLSLNARPFLTIPYLGRGSVDVTTESQLLQGESSFAPKSVSTVMENSFIPYREINIDEYMKKRIDNYNSTINILEGYDSRDSNRDPITPNMLKNQQNRPTNGGIF